MLEKSENFSINVLNTIKEKGATISNMQMKQFKPLVPEVFDF